MSGKTDGTLRNPPCGHLLVLFAPKIHGQIGRFIKNPRTTLSAARSGKRPFSGPSGIGCFAAVRVIISHFAPPFTCARVVAILTQRASPLALALELCLRVRAELRGCALDCRQRFLRAPPCALARCGDDGVAFVAIHETRRVEQRRLFLGRDDDEAVLVRMNKIAGPHGAAKDLHLAIPTHRMHMRVPPRTADGRAP